MQCIVVKSDEFENSSPLYTFPLNPDYVAARSLRSLRGNNNFTCESRYFVHFFAIIAPLRYEISLFHEPALWSRWTQHKYRFLFQNLDNDRYSPKENFTKICQIKWNWITSVKFEMSLKVRIDFQVTLSVCCHQKILLPL